ncbi:MAG: thiamine pyrophosphate-dependent enzyme [Acidobacteria bacterium]|nr:thiamine pyrophosphate-dependent enzyme [Acidobacteriota bacterium]
MLAKHQLLAPLAALRKDAVVVTTMGTVRPWGQYSNSDLDFASADSAMGHAADLALGIALAQPRRKVICLNGDGSMLMTLGTLVTAAQSDAANFILFVVENGTYEITGNQPVPGTGFVDFAAMSRAAGFRQAFSFDDPEDYETRLPSVLECHGPVLVAVRVEPGIERALSRNEREEARYLRTSLAESAHRLHGALTKV